MSQQTIIDQIREYSEKSVFSETGISKMLDIPQAIFSNILNGKYPYGTAVIDQKIEVFVNETSHELDLISRKLKVLSVINYQQVPDSLLFKRMLLHRRRCELMNKTGVRKPTKAAAPLQS